jgi:hypothetical protein
MALRDQDKEWKRRLIRVLKICIPFLVVLGAYVWWRFFVYVVPIEKRNNPIGLETLLSEPVRGLQLIFSNLFPDLVSIVATTWFKVLDAGYFDLFDRRNLLFLILSAGVAGAAFFLFTRQENREDDDTPPRASLTSEVFWLGLIIAVLGLIPPYVAGLYINEKNPLWNSRFGLASMPGASLLLVYAWETVSRPGRVRYAVLAALIGLSVGFHARYVNEYRWAWKKQVNFYRQLSLRAPQIKPGTTIMTPEEVLSYMGEYPTAYALNTIYTGPGTELTADVDFWYLTIYGNFASRMDEMLAGAPIEVADRSLQFQGNTSDSLIFSFEPEAQQCLYLMRPQDASFRGFSSLLKLSAPLSNPERIEPVETGGSPFLDAIGVDFQSDWCSYYVRADLARQYRRWNEVTLLWDAAHEQGLAPGYYFEYLPFLDAHVNLNQWDLALELSFLAEREFPAALRPLCDYWYAIPESPEWRQAMEVLIGRFSCQ